MVFSELYNPSSKTTSYGHPVMLDPQPLARGPVPKQLSYAIPDDWRGKYGASLSGEHVRLRLSGNLAGPIIIVLGGISADGRITQSDDNGWWREIACPGGAIDTDRYCILGMEYPPHHLGEAVDLCPQDFAELLALALDDVGIERIHALIGSSFGGMLGLAFSRLYPERLERLCVISAAHKPHPLAQAWRLIQRKAIRLGIENGTPEAGVALARELAMTTYRSPGEFGERFSSCLDDDGNVRHYLTNRGEDYAQRVSAERYLTLSGAIDRHDEDPSQITTSSLIIGVDTDQLVPLDDIKTLHAGLAGPAELVTLTSPYGHDAFLKQQADLAAPLATFLARSVS